MEKYQVEVFSVYREKFEVEGDSPSAAAVRLLQSRDVGRYMSGEYAGLLPEAGVEGVSSITSETGDGSVELLDQVASEIFQDSVRSFVTRYRIEEAVNPTTPPGTALEALEEYQDELQDRYRA